MKNKKHNWNLVLRTTHMHTKNDHLHVEQVNKFRWNLLNNTCSFIGCREVTSCSIVRTPAEAVYRGPDHDAPFSSDWSGWISVQMPGRHTADNGTWVGRRTRAADGGADRRRRRTNDLRSVDSANECLRDCTQIHTGLEEEKKWREKSILKNDGVPCCSWREQRSKTVFRAALSPGHEVIWDDRKDAPHEENLDYEVNKTRL